MRSKIAILPPTIRGKLAVLVVLSVLIAVGLAVYAVLVVPGLTVQAARPVMVSGSAALATSFRDALRGTETVVRHSQVKPAIIQMLTRADAGDPTALAFLPRHDAEVTATSGIVTAALLSPGGKVLNETGPDLTAADLQLARRCAVKGRILYGTPYLAGRTAMAAMAVPVFAGGHGPLAGVQAAVFDLSSLAGAVDEEASEVARSRLRFILLTSGGTVLYDYRRSGLGRPFADGIILSLLPSLHGDEPVYAGRLQDPRTGRPIAGVLARLPATGYDLYVLTEEDVPAVDPALPLLLALCSLAVGAVCVYVGGPRLIQPIREAVAAARSFGGGDLSARIPLQRDAEFHDLALAFNAAAAVQAESSRVEALLAVARDNLGRNQSEEAVLQTVTDYACRILGARLAVLWTPGEDDEPVPQTVSGAAGPGWERTGPAICVGLLERTGFRYLVCTNEPCVSFANGGSTRPPETGPQWRRAACEWASAHGLQGIVALPLCYQGVARGVLNCWLDHPDEPPARALDAVQSLAVTAAAGLHGLFLREETMLSLAAALEARDDETQVHALRVALYAERLAWEMEIRDPEELQRIYWGALLHDVGKIGLSDAVLRKAGPLTQEEWRQVRLHPRIGYGIISRLDFLGDGRRIVLSHHERFDGSGYPEGLRGHQIPVGARIFAAVDTFDAICADRPYSRARTYQEAWAEIRRVAGTQLDPDVAVAFGRIGREEWEKLRRRAETDFPLRRFRSVTSPEGRPAEPSPDAAAAGFPPPPE